MSFNGTDTHLKPRLCYLLKWPDFNGYGFNLHAEKGKAGQYIGKVDEGSPSQAAGLKDGDRIVEVNGINIGNENHQQVVGRIKQLGDQTSLLVVDKETDQHYKDQKKVVKGDLEEVVELRCPSHDTAEPTHDDVPPSYGDATEEEHVTSTQVETVQSSVTTTTITGSQFVPRLCHMKKRADFNGYGFNLHAERDKPGQFIGKIDDDSPAQTAELREADRIVEVNGVNIESESHQRVIELVKSGGDSTRLLVVDKAADEYYKSQGTTISSSLSEVKMCYSENEEGQVAAVVETPQPPVFHIPPPPTDIPPPVDEEEDFNVDELRNLGISDEAVEDVVQASQELETEVTPAEDLPPPQEETFAFGEPVEQELSAQVADVVQTTVIQDTEEFAQNSEEVVENAADVPNEYVSNDVEITRDTEVEAVVAAAIAAEVETEPYEAPVQETFVSEVSENVASPPQVEEQVEKVSETPVETPAEQEPTVETPAETPAEPTVETPEPTVETPEPTVETPAEPTVETPVETPSEPPAEVPAEIPAEPVKEVESSAINGQTVTETVTTYTAPEPEPEPTPAPVIKTEPISTPAPKQANGAPDGFGISAAEMRERLKARKKVDPRAAPVNFAQKHKMFERM